MQDFRSEIADSRQQRHVHLRTAVVPGELQFWNCFSQAVVRRERFYCLRLQGAVASLTYVGFLCCIVRLNSALQLPRLVVVVFCPRTASSAARHGQLEIATRADGNAHLVDYSREICHLCIFGSAKGHLRNTAFSLYFRATTGRMHGWRLKGDGGCPW